MTCFLAVLDHEECVTLASVEPRHAVACGRAAPGRAASASRVGAPGKAILVAAHEAEWPADADLGVRAEVVEAGACAAATPRSHDEVIPTRAVGRRAAAPCAGERPAAIAVVHVGSRHDDDAEIAARADSARPSAVREALGG